MKKRPFLSTGLFAVLGRSGGFLLPFLIAYIYGAGRDTDAFFMAYALVIALTGFFNPVFESVFVPLVTRYKQTPQRILHLSNGIVWSLFPVVAFLTAIVWAGLPFVLTHWSGLDSEGARMVQRLFGELTPMVLLGVWVGGCIGIFYTFQVFWFPALSPLIRSICVFGAIFLFHKTAGIHAVTLGFSAGETVRWACGVFLLAGLSFWTIKTPWKEIGADLKDFYKHSALQLLAFFAINIIPMTDQLFASWLGVGQVSLLNYASRLFEIPYQFCLTGLLQIFLSDWSHSRHFDSREALKGKINRDIRNLFVIGSVLGLILWIGRHFWVRLVYGFGSLDDQQLQLIGDLFGWLILGFVPAVLHLMYCRILFVMKKSGVFFVQAWIKLALNVFFNWLFIRYFGIRGIAMSTALVFAVTAGWLWIYTDRIMNRPGTPS